MKELRYTRQFKKDLKRFLNQPKKLEELKIVLDMLRNEITLPEKYRQHPLKGEYSGSGLAPIPSCLRSSVATLFQRNYIIEQ